MGLTPVMGAVAHHNVEAVVMLLNNGADIRSIAVAGPHAGTLHLCFLSFLLSLTGVLCFSCCCSCRNVDREVGGTAGV